MSDGPLTGGPLTCGRLTGGPLTGGGAQFPDIAPWPEIAGADAPPAIRHLRVVADDA